MSSTSTLKAYYYLTKPGIIRGNLLTAAAGFFLASQKQIDWVLLLAALGGLALVIASGCVFNNYIDRHLDKKMERTKKRALVTQTISARNALIYATSLGVIGTLILSMFANLLTASMALMGFFFYVVVYGYWKRQSVHGTLVGSISGAIPPVVGYCAVSNRLDLAALLLFLILVFWQMPHFYAIGIYRLKDYEAAGLPILPVKKGYKAAQKQILFYIPAFTIAAVSLTLYGYTGHTYAAIMGLLGGVWLGIGLKGHRTIKPEKWAAKMFGFSLIVLMSFSIVLILDPWLP